MAKKAPHADAPSTDNKRAKLPTSRALNADIATANVYELTGYNPKRDEFEPDFDNEAESAIADIEFRPDDAPEDERLKLRMLEIYNRRLRDRVEHRSFVLKRGLLNVKKSQAGDKRKSVEERRALARFRVFA